MPFTVPGAAQPPAEESRTAQIDALLERRADAILSRDRGAFMATISSDSSAFRRRQRRLFDNLSSVPLSAYELRAAWERFGDLARPSDRRRYPGTDDVAIPLTEERYRIRAFDDDAAVEDHYFTFTKQAGRWLIAEDTDLDELGLHTSRHLWDFGRVRTSRTGDFLVLEHPCDGSGRCGRLPDGFVDLADQALTRMRSSWPVRWREKVVVFVPATHRELTRMLQATFDLDNFVAFAYTTVDGSDGIDFTAPRIVFSYESLAGRSTESIVSILAHELLHVATRAGSGPFVPVFVEEGFAEYAANGSADPLEPVGSEVGSGVFDRSLPADFEFVTGGGTSILRSYQESHSAVDYFIQRWGLKKFVRFYRDLGSREMRAGTARYHLNDALGQVTGVSFPAFERAWADSIDG